MADVAVVGAGVVGLTTALRAQQRGGDVVVVARELPEQTTSAVAAAIWYPYLAAHADAEPWSLATFAWLHGLAADPATGVAMREVAERRLPGAARPAWVDRAGCLVAQTADELRLRVPVADTRQFLPWLRDRVLAGGGRIEQRELCTLDEVSALAPRVANCTGLGAGPLCGDDGLVPVRGQVVVVATDRVRCAWIDDTGADPVYLVPRGDEVVCGGTAQRGDARREPDAADTARILAACAPRLGAGPPAVRAVAVGLRPWRATVRLEREDRCGHAVVHNYGHGGAGYTLAWGAAGAAVELLLT